MDLFQKCYDFTRADEIKALGMYPYFRAIEENEGPVVQIEGKKVVMAGSNNYLGLTADPRVKDAAMKALEKYGTGCSGSRYLTGTLDLHIELEEKMAKFFRKEAVLLLVPVIKPRRELFLHWFNAAKLLFPIKIIMHV
ncbi:MAG: aminotransferase class I/II-fold pyridoxal phosphate-dependent enzyme [Melioribacteraceae bacterium]|nr:aminotransferase class I/II-fold pyridoxal phosphate-dependent enzyme [Melioribacteraceae bacterium]